MIQAWIGEQFPNGAMTVVDCLGAQWAPTTLFQAWDHNIAQFPVPPNATGIVQGPDTHVHSQYQAYIRDAKDQIQMEGEIAAKQTGCEYDSHGGPEELMELLSRAMTKFLEYNTKRDVALASGCANQTFIYLSLIHI